jgi:peptidoglycan/LPS O-acetylase OafA/YrhL
LAVEWQYYLLLPLIAWGISLFARRGPLQERLLKLVFCLGLLLVWGLGTRYSGLYFLSHPSSSFIVSRSTLNKVLFFTYGTQGKYLEDFAVGMLISVVYTFTRHAGPAHPFSVMMHRFSSWIWRLGIIVLVFMALWRMDWVFYNTWPFLNGLAHSGYWLNYYDWLNEVCFAVGYGLCVMAILHGPSELQRPFAWNPLRSIGLISYSMYMWHLPLILLFLTYFGHRLEGTNYFAVFGIYWTWVLLVIIPFSFLSFVFIEKPGMLFGNRFRPPTEPLKRELPPLPAHPEAALVE